MLYITLDRTILAELIFPPSGSLRVGITAVPENKTEQDKYWRDIIEQAGENNLMVVYDDTFSRHLRLFPARNRAEYDDLLHRSYEGVEREIEQKLQLLAEKGLLVARADLFYPCRERRPEVEKLRHGDVTLREGTIHLNPNDSWKDDIDLDKPTSLPVEKGELRRYPTSGDTVMELSFYCSAPPQESDEADEELDEELGVTQALRSSLSFTLTTPWKQVVATVYVSNSYWIV